MSHTTATIRTGTSVEINDEAEGEFFEELLALPALCERYVLVNGHRKSVLEEREPFEGVNEGRQRGVLSIRAR